MSLFQEIRRLCLTERQQTEDILSEIVAAVFRNSSDLALDWLKRIGATDLAKVDSFGVATQERFSKLDGHDLSSRMDMVIRLAFGNRRQVVYIESKVGSGLGPGQLQRYADHLKNECLALPGTEGCLVYITRDYDPVAKPSVEGFDFRFCTTRWSDFYRLLKIRSERDGLEVQLKEFMQENHMTTSNQFRSSQLVALENFMTARAIMDETLSVVPFGDKNMALDQLREYSRYVKRDDIAGLELLVGYWLPVENPDDPVWVGVKLGANPKLAQNATVIQALEKWRETAGWEHDDFDFGGDWVSIRQRKSLNSMLATEDHVQEITGFFRLLLAEVADFRRPLRDLPSNVPLTKDQ